MTGLFPSRSFGLISVPFYVTDTCGTGWRLQLGAVEFAANQRANAEGAMFFLDFEEAARNGVDLNTPSSIMQYKTSIEAELRAEGAVSISLLGTVRATKEAGSTAATTTWKDALAEYGRINSSGRSIFPPGPKNPGQGLPLAQFEQSIIIAALLNMLGSGRVVIDPFDMSAAQAAIREGRLLFSRHGDPIQYVIEIVGPDK
jgi:hypothetical protein